MSSAKEHVAQRLLSRAHSPASSVKLFSEKVQLRPLLLKPSEPSNTTPDARSRRRNARLATLAKRKNATKPKPLSVREKRALGVHDIPKDECKYDLYAPLHKIWLGYIKEILGISDGKFKSASTGSAATLVSADYHGALLEVVRSRCPSRVGIKGIVVRDTKFTFDIITKGNELKTIPKEHTTFKFEISLQLEKAAVLSLTAETKPQERLAVFELHGEQFQHRAVDRANKKFKPHFLPDL